jgi:hypothetical protein
MLYYPLDRLPILTHFHTTQSQPKHTYSANDSVTNNVIAINFFCTRFVYRSQIILQLLRFLGAFAKLRKATISFVMSVHPSIYPRGTTRLLIDGFS